MKCIVFVLLTLVAINKAQEIKPDIYTRQNVTLLVFNLDTNDPSSDPFLYVETFFIVYPKLLEEFNPDYYYDMEMSFFSNIDPYITAGTYQIFVDGRYTITDPEDVDIITWAVAEALIYTAYPYGEVIEPKWFVAALSNYARYVFGINNEAAGWSLGGFNASKHKNYTTGGKATSRFLVWIKNHYPGLVQKIHRTIVDSKYTVDVWQNETSKTIDDLWKDYTKNPTISRPKRAFGVNETMAAIRLAMEKRSDSITTVPPTPKTTKKLTTTGIANVSPSTTLKPSKSTISSTTLKPVTTKSSMDSTKTEAVAATQQSVETTTKSAAIKAFNFNVIYFLIFTLLIMWY